MKSLGLDFGTANSSMAFFDRGRTDVFALDGQGGSIPSTLFFDFEDNNTYVGDAAYERYYFGDKGRFLRSFKSALGTSTLDHEIQIKHERFTIKDIIQHYIGTLIERTAQHLEKSVESLVVGRPIYFVDDDPMADAQAEQSLREIVSSLGVKQLAFQYEPIAAALNYGIDLSKQEQVLVVDIGAGTSDFSVVNFKAVSLDQAEFEAEVISNCGVHIGGNDFDRLIALDYAMPLFGYGQRFKRREQLEVPNHYFQNAASWHKIEMLYDRKVLTAMQEISPQVFEPELIERFLELLKSRQVHNVLAEVEITKKALSNSAEADIDLAFLETGLRNSLSSKDFESLIESLCREILENASRAVELAGLSLSDIDTVYLTGGSMGIRHLHDKIVKHFNQSHVIEGDRSTAVARGLAIHAHQIGFG